MKQFEFTNVSSEELYNLIQAAELHERTRMNKNILVIVIDGLVDQRVSMYPMINISKHVVTFYNVKRSSDEMFKGPLTGIIIIDNDSFYRKEIQKSNEIRDFGRVISSYLQ